MNIITNFENIENNESFTYSDVRNNVSGGQSLSILNNNKKVIIQTPVCTLPFGVTEYNTNQGNKYSIELSLRKCDTFVKFLNNIDNQNVQHVIDNSETIFKKQLSEEIVSSLYKSTTKKSEKFPPILKMKLPTNSSGEFTGEIYDSTGTNLLSMKDLKKGVQVQVISELIGMYFVPKEFGITWKVLQLRVLPFKQLKGYSFIEEEINFEEPEPMK